MKNLFILFICGTFLICSAENSNAQIKDLIKKVTGGEKTESNDKTVADGLKEALNIGTGNAVKSVSSLDGFFKNELIKIVMPSSMQKYEKALKTLGAGKIVDDFVLSMNRAAEDASKEAAPIFVSAIKKMTINDAVKILKGRENEATLYFQEKTTDSLSAKFNPIISKSMDENNVTKYYKQLNDKVKNIPFASKLNVDLDDYVTQKALEGLFTVVGQEEAKIRKDPAARVTDLLKTVFGKN